VTFAALTGSESHTLSFSRPVRLLLPGGADKEIGAIDKNGTYQAITASLPVDTLAAAEARLIDAAPFAKIASVPTPPSGRKKARFSWFPPRLIPPSLARPGDPFGLRLSGRDPFPAHPGSFAGGDTPLSLLLRESGLSVGLSGSYVSRIGTLSEFDHGPGSGWMYQVDGTAPSSTAADAYSLQRGQHVSWRYTTDLGEDIGSAYVPPAGQEIVLTGDPGTLTAGFEVASAASNGTASAALAQEQIKEAFARGPGRSSPARSLRFWPGWPKPRPQAGLP
jgi:hypothetical protein